ncbi:MAG: hypothetical protein WKG07_09285 [Hymenobacter sp.]
MPQLLFRVSVPGTDDDGGPKSVPGFGSQIQPVAVVNGVVVVGTGRRYGEHHLRVEQPQPWLTGSPTACGTPTYTPTVTLPAGTMISAPHWWAWRPGPTRSGGRAGYYGPGRPR